MKAPQSFSGCTHLHSTTLCSTGRGYTQKQCVAETRDQNLLFPGTWAKKGLTSLQSSKSEEKAAITAFAQVVQEHTGSFFAFLVPPRHRTDVGRRGPSLFSPVRSQLCKDDFAAPSGNTRAQMPSPAGLCCLHILEPSSILHRAFRVQLSPHL